MTRLVPLLIFLLPHVSHAQLTEGSMTCTIKSQKITRIKNGIAKVSNRSPRDNLKVGSRLKLEYRFNKKTNEVDVRLAGKERTFLYSTGTVIIDRAKLNYDGGRITLFLKFFGLTSEIRLTKDFIVLTGSNVFERYAKDSWMGITTGTTRPGNVVTNETISWDCQQSQNATLSDFYMSLRRHLF